MTFAAALACHAATTAAPADPATPPTLAHCAEIGAAADRLACYDRLAGRAEAAPAVASTPSGAPLPPATSKLAPSNTAANQSSAPVTAPAGSGAASTAVSPTATTTVAAGGSLLSKFWELEAADQRGVFNFIGYRANFVLPLRVMNRVNRAPESPTQPATQTPDYRRAEGKIQLSLRTKLAQDVLGSTADVWAGYTQQSYWQVYAESKPFRNTDYEPEVMAVLPMPSPLRSLPFGWQWRYAQLGLAHQSNGQAAPLSRSWNRVYLGTGFERGDVSLVANLQSRLRERNEDDNPDLLAYRGRADVMLAWTPGLSTATLTWRGHPKDPSLRGSVQVEWTYPVKRDQPNGLRWYVQGFSGYAETLTDYNFRQRSIGAGLSFLQF